MSQSLFIEPLLPVVHAATLYDLPPGEPFAYPLHNHPDLAQMLLICNGGGTFQIDGRNYEGGPGTLLVYDSGVWHEEQSDADKPFKALSLTFSGFQLSGLPPSTFIARPASSVIALGDRYEELYALMSMIVRLMDDSYAPSKITVGHYMAIVLVELARIVYSGFAAYPAKNGDQMVTMVKQYIHSHYTEKLSLEELSKVSFLSPGYTCRLFSQAEGVSPIQYLVAYRMEVAKHHLLTSDLPVYRIAELVGYQSETHFKNTFKRLVGLSPRQYRIGM